MDILFVTISVPYASTNIYLPVWGWTATIDWVCGSGWSVIIIGFRWIYLFLIVQYLHLMCLSPMWNPLIYWLEGVKFWLLKLGEMPVKQLLLGLGVLTFHLQYGWDTSGGIVVFIAEGAYHTCQGALFHAPCDRALLVIWLFALLWAS